MDFTAFKEKIREEAAAAGISQYELLYMTNDSVSVSAFGGQIADFTAGITGGVCFRCIVDGHMGLAYTQDLSDSSARSLVLRAADNASVIESEETEYFSEGGGDYEDYEPANMAQAAPEELVNTVLSGLEALKAADEKVTDGCSASGGATVQEMYLMNSNGVDLKYRGSMDYLFLEAVVSNGTEDNNEYELKLGEPKDLDLNDIAKKATDKAVSMLGAGTAPTGSFPVVFSPEAFTSFLQVFSSSFSSDNAAKGLSVLKGKEGEVIAADIVTVIDDPFYPDNPARINFDAEGSPAHKKAVISNGKLETLLYNLKTAHAAGRETTGNAHRAGYDSPVVISPFTMYLVPGEFTEEELFEKAGNGVYITSLGGLHAGANQITGDFSLMSSGFMITDGKKGEPVKSFTVAGNFFDMLKDVTAIGSNIKLPMPLSSTAFASPSVLVRELSVSGK
ncbi:MAG: TldD/PmbA family protein [Lachnospiraceae bacterium]|nr:TldD/PmbA family protein [Lachnospiraceae bacterium]